MRHGLGDGCRVVDVDLRHVLGFVVGLGADAVDRFARDEYVRDSESYGESEAGQDNDQCFHVVCVLSETKLLRRRFDNAKVGSLYTMGKLWFVFVSITAIVRANRSARGQSLFPIAKIGIL